MRRGRSGRTLVGEGLEGWKLSWGQANLASLVGIKVGVVKTAVLVCGKEEEIYKDRIKRSDQRRD